MTQVPEIGPLVTITPQRFSLGRTIRELVAVVVWVSAILKLFVFDVDRVLLERIAPTLGWLVSFRFFVIIGCVGLACLVFKKKTLAIWSLYLLCYPLIILFWRVPYFLWKQKSWNLVVALVDVIAGTVRSLKYNVIAFAVYLISVGIILNGNARVLVWLAVGAVVAVTLASYVRRFIQIFRRSAIYELYRKIFSKFRASEMKSLSVEENLRCLPRERMTGAQLQTWTTGLQNAVLINRVCLFSARRLRDYQNSGLNYVAFCFAFLFLTILTVLSFACANYGVYQIMASDLAVVGHPTFFTFFYYSFANQIARSIAEITPTRPITQLLLMLQFFCSLLVAFVFVALLVSARRQRLSHELGKVVEGLEAEGHTMEEFISTHYQMATIADAISALQQVKAGLINLIYHLSK